MNTLWIYELENVYLSHWNELLKMPVFSIQLWKIYKRVEEEEKKSEVYEKPECSYGNEAANQVLFAHIFFLHCKMKKSENESRNWI